MDSSDIKCSRGELLQNRWVVIYVAMAPFLGERTERGEKHYDFLR